MTKTNWKEKVSLELTRIELAGLISMIKSAIREDLDEIYCDSVDAEHVDNIGYAQKMLKRLKGIEDKLILKEIEKIRKEIS